MIKVSFIVPVYNVEKYIAQCIESLREQKEKEIEIILVDDGSKDDSLIICKAYQKKDDRIKVIHQENQGACVARNKGLLEAKGTWICFVDGDDWVENNICSNINLPMIQNYDIIFYSYNKIYGNKRKRSPSYNKIIEFEKKDFYELQIATLNRLGPYKYNAKILDTVSIWNKMYRRDFLLKNNLFFIPQMPKLQDLTFNLKVYDYAQNGIYVNIAAYNYRINLRSVSNCYQPDITQKFEIIHKFLESFISQKKAKVYQVLFNERVTTHLRTCLVLYYCNSQNKDKYRKRKKEFLKLLKQEPYATAIEKTDLTHYTLKEHILSWAIKYRIFWLCELLCKCNSLIQKLYIAKDF